jgi:hypothetical protein
MQAMDMTNAWLSIKDRVKERVTGRSVWQALDSLTPITQHEATAVFGMPAMATTLISHVNTPAVKRIIEQLLLETMGTKLEVLVIEGATLQDWDAYQLKQEETRRMSEAGLHKRTTEQRSYDTWETIYEQVGRRFAETQGRSLAQNRAKYLQESIQIVQEALERLSIENEQDERQLNRVLERIATNVDAPAAMIGWLILYKNKS